MWAGNGFTQNVAMLWLISCFASFLCSCLLLEPIKVIFFFSLSLSLFFYAHYVVLFSRRLRIIKPSEGAMAAIRW